MQGDFSRITFDPLKHFSRVLMQQGRVQLDADWNEQVSILLHLMRTLAMDLIGEHGGPDRRTESDTELLDFDIDPSGTDSITIMLGAGHYYVHGILCENEEIVTYPHLFNLGDAHPAAFVYLDVWEGHITPYQDTRYPFHPGHPNLREVALGGPDTTSRAKVLWQVRADAWEPGPDLGIPLEEELQDGEEVRRRWEKLVESLQPARRGCLRAWATKPDVEPEPCLTDPEARYRGAENQLYRVEIHKGGIRDEATFKWSRDNGSVIYPILKVIGGKITLEHLGRDSYLSLKCNDWVEVVNDNQARKGEAGVLAQVKDVDQDEMTVELTNFQEGGAPPWPPEPMVDHWLLRRWDSPGALKFDEEVEISLEKGIQILFQRIESESEKHTYRTGDYWLIPARVATGDVEWPVEWKRDGKPHARALPPHGVEHHYAPLALVYLSVGVQAIDLRRLVKPLAVIP